MVVAGVVVLVVGGSGGWMIPHSRLASTRAINRHGCLHSEADFARKAQFPAISPSGAMGAPWRAPGPGGGGGGGGGSGVGGRWQQAEDDSAAQDRPSSHDPPQCSLLLEAESARNAIYHANSASGALAAGAPDASCHAAGTSS